MNPTLLALRAITTELARRVYLPIATTVAVLTVLLILLSIWLLTLSAWWLLFAIPLYVLLFVITSIFVVFGVALALISPVKNKKQKQSVKLFVDHVQSLSEIAQTPKTVLLFRIIKDAASSNKTAYIQSVITDTRALRQKYQSIIADFS